MGTEHTDSICERSFEEDKEVLKSMGILNFLHHFF